VKRRFEPVHSQLRRRGLIYLAGFLPTWALAMFLWPEPFEITSSSTFDLLLYFSLRIVFPFLAGIGLQVLLQKLRSTA